MFLIRENGELAHKLWRYCWGPAAWEMRSQGNDRARNVGAGSSAIVGNFVRVGDGLWYAVATAQGVTGVGGHSTRGANTPPHALQILCMATCSAFASWDRQFAAENHMQLRMQVHGLTDVGVVATQGIVAGVNPLGGAERDRCAQARHKQRDCMCTARKRQQKHNVSELRRCCCAAASTVLAHRASCAGCRPAHVMA